MPAPVDTPAPTMSMIRFALPSLTNFATSSSVGLSLVVKCGNARFGFDDDGDMRAAEGNRRRRMAASRTMAMQKARVRPPGPNSSRRGRCGYTRSFGSRGRDDGQIDGEDVGRLAGRLVG